MVVAVENPGTSKVDLDVPLVSVVVPSYNSERTILRAISSVRAQDWPRIELIVVDDCSKDTTREVIAGLSDEYLVLSTLPENRGASAARNRGIALTSGKYVAFLDADDEWHGSKISRQVRAMEAEPNASICTCDCLFITERGERRGTFFTRRTPASGPNAWQTLLAYNYIQTSTVLARKEDLDALGGFSEALPTGEDQDLWIRLALRGSVCVEAGVLVNVYDEPVSLAKRFRRNEADVLLATVKKHLLEFGESLDKAQVNSIWGQRLYDNAANLYCSLDFAKSASLFWKAGLMGWRPFRSYVNAVRALILAFVRTRGMLIEGLRAGNSLAKLSRF